MKIKKIWLIALLVILVVAMAGCGNVNKIDENKPTVVCTGFAQYDWVLNILGDEAGTWNVVRINDKGADMHSYQPSAEDMIIISKADVIIYTGGMSEEWIEEAVESQDFNGKAYALLDNCEPICIEEENGHEEHDHESGDTHEHHGHSHDEYDEHVWLSLDNAIGFCKDIATILDEVNPSDNYNVNCQEYIEKLQILNDQFEDAIWQGENNMIVFADRFPFRYLAEDYDLKWHAAFPGCSAETEASFDTLKELSNIIEESEITGIFVTETADDALAKTVINNAEYKDVEILEVNSMQSISAKEKTSYIEIMEDNLELICSALS